MGNAQSSLKSVQFATDQLAEQSKTAETLKNKLDATLNGTQIEKLENDLQQVEGDFEAAQLKSDVIRASLKYLEAVSSGSDHEMCPACDAGFESGYLKSQLQDLDANGDLRTNEILEKRDQLRQQISTANQLANQIQTLETQIDGHKRDVTEILEYAKKTFGLPSPPTIVSLQDYVEEINRGHQDLQSVLDSQTEALDTWQA